MDQNHTHILIKLLKIVEKIGVEVPDKIKTCAKELGGHYTQARYPDTRITEYEKYEAEKAIKCMGGAFKIKTLFF